MREGGLFTKINHNIPEVGFHKIPEVKGEVYNSFFPLCFDHENFKCNALFVTLTDPTLQNSPPFCFSLTMPLPLAPEITIICSLDQAKPFVSAKQEAVMFFPLPESRRYS